MITNCPNCGSVIDMYGNCAYCGTRVVQSFNIFNGGSVDYGNYIEININVIDQYGKKFIIPLRGSINCVEVKRSMFEETEVEFTFTGRIRE